MDWDSFKIDVKKIVKTECTKRRNRIPSQDILDTKQDRVLAKMALVITQNYMIKGIIWQKVICKVPNFINMDERPRHKLYKVDVINMKKKFAIEVKNKYNTMNSSSYKTIKDKLAEIKLHNSDFRCIIGIINGKNGKSSTKKIIHKYRGKKIELEKITGDAFLKLLFNSNYKKAIKLIRKEMEKYRTEEEDIVHNIMKKYSKICTHLLR